MVRFLFATIFFLWGAVQAQEIQVEISPRNGTKSDEYQFQITISNSADTRKPTLIGGDDFEKVYIGPQSSVTIINGDMTATIRHIYKLYPKRIGTLQTPIVKVELPRKTLTARSLSVEVRKETFSEKKNKDFFLKQEVNKKRAYEGEQIVNTIKLYSKKKLLEASFLDLSYKKVWVEEFGKQQNYLKNVKGTSYTVNELRRALFPLISGDITLPSRSIQIRYVDNTRRRDLFSGLQLFDTDFFGLQQSKVSRIETGPLELTILPLPPKPTSSGNSYIPVGETRLSLGIQSGNIQLGSGKTVTFVVESFGNLHGLEQLPFSSTKFFKIYPELPKATYEQKNGKLLTKKTFSYSVVPLSEGVFHLPELELTYFNTDKEQYDVTKSRSTSFIVQRTENSPKKQKPLQEQGELSSGQKNEKEPLTPYVRASDTPRYSPLFIVVFCIACLALLIALFLFHRFIKKSRDSRALLAKIRNAQTIAECRNMYLEFLAAKLNIENIKVLTLNEVYHALEQNIDNSSVLFAIRSHFDLFNQSEYGTKEEGENFERLRDNIFQFARKL